MTTYDDWIDEVSFERCPDEDCGGRVSSSGRCRLCARTPDEVEEQRGDDAEGDEG